MNDIISDLMKEYIIDDDEDKYDVYSIEYVDHVFNIEERIIINFYVKINHDMENQKNIIDQKIKNFLIINKSKMNFMIL